jgi:hypothetical protein
MVTVVLTTVPGTPAAVVELKLTEGGRGISSSLSQEARNNMPNKANDKKDSTPYFLKEDVFFFIVFIER